MSLIPMAFACTLAVACYETDDIQITDTQYVKQGANDVQSILQTRTIKGAIDKSGAKKFEAIFGGSVSDGSIAIYTQDELFFSDAYAAGGSQVQSYFIWENLNYRVIGIDPWHKQTGIRIYLASRHITQDII
jgi:hypothetical protein